MGSLYNIAIHLTSFFLRVAQLFSPKLKLFVQGRKNTFSTLNEKIQPKDKTIWFHCASLGEYEQGVPIMKAVKRSYPNYKLIVSFFSPSGYENKKNSNLADAVVYLPMDTKSNAQKFIKAIHPTYAIFVKYEFWPNYLFELERQKIKTLLISGLFRKDQVFFKDYGGFMRKALRTFDHIFVQENASEILLREINLTNVSVSGDTRFDRVSHQIEMDNKLPFIEEFLQDSLCVVCGSTWPEDETVLLEYINNAPQHVKFIIAPHKIEASKISTFRKKLKPTSILYSEKEGELLSGYQILIIDNIGLLTKIYSYADIAYVGGAMGTTGLHNILEPATFGVPIIIGKHYKEFPEAGRLQSLAGLFSIKDAVECSEILGKLVIDTAVRNKTGMISGHFVNSNTGATRMVMEYINMERT